MKTFRELSEVKDLTHEVLTGAGLVRHARGYYEGQAGDRLKPDLEAAGWTHETNGYRGQYRIYSHPDTDERLHVTQRGVMYSRWRTPQPSTPF